MSSINLVPVGGLHALLDEQLAPITEFIPATWSWGISGSDNEDAAWTYQIHTPQRVLVPSHKAAYYHGLYSSEGQIVAVLPILGRPVTAGSYV